MYATLIKHAASIHRTKLGRAAIRLSFRTSPGRAIALYLASNAEPEHRRLVIEAVQRVYGDIEGRKRLIARARELYERQPRDISLLDCYALALLYSEDHDAAWSLLNSPAANAAIENDAKNNNLIGARITLGFETAKYKDVVETARFGVCFTPETLRPRIDYLKSAFAAGKMRRERDALEFFGRQYHLIDDRKPVADDRDLERVVGTLAKQSIRTLATELRYEEYKSDGSARIGVFFLSSTEALGHAVLDPYHFIALNRDKFDRLIFVGPPRSSYRPASRSCLQIVEQYGDYIETGSDILMNLSWMSLGRHPIGPMTLVVDHYWALLRQAVHRSRDKFDAFRHNAWHMSLPPIYAKIGEEFCERIGIVLDRPLVVLHVRDSAYHQISKQSFRDSAIDDYRATVEYLLDTGYQVVRIGDPKMPKLNIDRAGYFELPFLEDYRHELDPFLISRAHFMIGCQSGPCAFARVLGVPLLTVNAVLHYTLLPAAMEMACFKRYFLEKGGVRREMSLNDALDAGIYHFENSFQFQNAGITLENASASEILDSAKDMISWLKHPELAETALQNAFRSKAEAVAQRLEERSDELDLRIADYLGICLPGYRISPSVALTRAGHREVRSATDATADHGLEQVPVEAQVQQS